MNISSETDLTTYQIILTFPGNNSPSMETKIFRKCDSLGKSLRMDNDPMYVERCKVLLFQLRLLATTEQAGDSPTSNLRNRMNRVTQLSGI